MTDARDSIHAVHDYLEEVDWDLIEEAAAAGSAVARYLRDRPWLVIAAGVTLTSLGSWLVWSERRQGGEHPTVTEYLKR